MNVLGFVLPLASVGLGSLLIKPRRGFFQVAQPDKQGPPQPPLIPQVTIEEMHNDELQITDHPVEQGAAISDHAFKRPAEIIIHCAWSNSPSKGTSLVSQAVGVGAAVGGSVARTVIGAGTTLFGGGVTAAQNLLTGNAPQQVIDIYKKLLALQESRELFDVYTGKRAYKNMLFRSLSVTTNKESESSLILTAACRQVIVVSTYTVRVPINSSAQKEPAKTTPTQNTGAQQPQDAPSFVPDASTLTGAATSLSGSFNEVATTLSQVSGGLDSLPGSIAGTMTQLSDVVGSCQEAMSDVLTNLPIPLEIPTIPGPEAFSIPLGSSMTPALSDALTSLPDVLNRAQSTLGPTLSQLSAAVGSIPTELAGLTDQLKGLQAQIPNVLEQASDVLARAAVPAATTVNQMTTAWNEAANSWTATIADATGNKLVSNIPLVTGANLVQQFGHLGFSGQFRAQTAGDPSAVPTRENFGTNSKLFFVGP